MWLNAKANTRRSEIKGRARERERYSRGTRPPSPMNKSINRGSLCVRTQMRKSKSCTTTAITAAAAAASLKKIARKIRPPESLQTTLLLNRIRIEAREGRRKKNIKERNREIGAVVAEFSRLSVMGGGLTDPIGGWRNEIPPRVYYIVVRVTFPLRASLFFFSSFPRGIGKLLTASGDRT